MKVMFQHPVDRLVGAVGTQSGGGVVYTETVDGRAVGRSYVKPSNPQSAAQVARRANLDTLSKLYKTLSDSQKSGWDTLGNSMIRQDELGRDYPLTPLGAFMCINSHRLLAGQASSLSAPTYGPPSAPTGITGITIDETNLYVSFTHGNAASGFIARLRLTPALQSASTLAQETDLRLPHSVTSNCYEAITSAVSDTLTFPYNTLDLFATDYVGAELVIFTTDYQPSAAYFDRNIQLTIEGA